MSNMAYYMSAYNNFRTPAFKITIDGTQLNAAYGISDLSVDLSVGETASGCKFRLSNVFNHKNHSITNEAKEKIVLGKIVKVSMGYSSDLKNVFTGYIDNINYSFDASSGASIEVTCLDARALMRMSVKREINLEKSIGEIIKDIFNDYKPLISSVDSSLDSLEIDKKLQLDKNDLDFILWLAQSRNRYFYIQGDTAYIVKKDSSPSFTYDFTNTVYSLDFTMNYLDVTYVAIANAKAGEASFTVSASAKQSGAQESPITKKLTDTYKIKASSQADAEKSNNAKASDAKVRCQTGSITSVGLPDLLPGKNVKISNFPMESASKQNVFYINSVRHAINNSGFTTSVSFGMGV